MGRACAERGCPRPHLARGRCGTHYARLRRAGALRPLPDAVVRFMASVDDSGGPDACWPWTGCDDGHGYGQLSWRGRTERAHRVAFELATGAPPVGVVRHSCDNPPCCNPAHLTDGTNRENLDDRDRKDRVRHGSAHPCAKLTEADVVAIRAEYAAGGVRQRDLAERYGVGRTTIAQLTQGRAWRRAS